MTIEHVAAKRVCSLQSDSVYCFVGSDPQCLAPTCEPQRIERLPEHMRAMDLAECWFRMAGGYRRR